MSDYNLDGKEDFVTWAELPGGATRWALYINNGNGGYTLKDSEITGTPSGHPYLPYEVELTPYTYTFSATYEFTGDGRPDVLMRAGDTLLCYTSESNSPSDNRLENYPTDYCITTGLSDSYTGDFNGDGIDEVLVTGTDVQAIHSFKLDRTWEIYLPDDDFIVSDVNGDSKSDLISFNSTGYAVYEFYYDSGTDDYYLGLAGEETNEDFKASLNEKMSEGDFNGDGYSDFLVKGITEWYIMTSTGSKFTRSDVIVPIDSLFNPYIQNADNGVYVRDINNDNKSDIITASTVYDGTSVDSVRVSFYIFNGSSFKKESYSLSTSEMASPGAFIFGDFTGDAAMDALLYMSTVIRTGGFDNRNLVRKIADGLNNKTGFSYKKGVFPDGGTRPSRGEPSCLGANKYHGCGYC